MIARPSSLGPPTTNRTRVRASGLSLTLAPALSALLAACSNSPSNLPPPVPAYTADRSNASVINGPSNTASTILSIEPWTAVSPAGRVIRTPAYRLFTTMPPGVTLSRLPRFMESALAVYRSAYATLPAPPLALDTFLLANRPQWMKLTAQMFPDEAEGFLKIPRGGFTLNARALLYDLGTRDTLALIGHEGWHQFTQQTFIDPLPIWLEEGIATHMEGFRWDTNDPTKPIFTPWANPDRFDQLRQRVEEGRLFSLAELLAGSPQDLIAQTATTSGNATPGPRDPQATLAYYAQVWALLHFLQEDQDGRHRQALATLVTDAAQGRLVGTIRASAGERAADAYLLHRRGPELFNIYFNADTSDAQARYRSFVERITRLGARELIVAGRSPV